MPSFATGPFQVQGVSSNQAVTVNLGVTAGSATVQVLSANSVQDQKNYTFRVSNPGAAPVWIELGPSTVTAALATGIPILTGQTEKFAVAPGTTHVAAIGTAAGPVTIYVTPGAEGS